MNGGYVMIDCKGLNLEVLNTVQTIPGFYSDTLRCLALNKPIILYNCAWATTATATPLAVFGVKYSDHITLRGDTYTFVINENDTVTVTRILV